MRVLCAATCARLRIMRAEGTFSLNRFDDEARHDDRLRGAGQIIIGPDGGHSYILDCEL